MLARKITSEAPKRQRPTTPIKKEQGTTNTNDATPSKAPHNKKRKSNVVRPTAIRQKTTSQPIKQYRSSLFSAAYSIIVIVVGFIYYKMYIAYTH